MKIREVGAELPHADRRTDGRPAIWRVAANILKNSHGQPTRGGPPAGGWARS